MRKTNMTMRRLKTEVVQKACQVLKHATELLSLCLLSSAFLLASCSSDGPGNIEPVVRTLAATDITRTSAILNGSIELDGKTATPSLYFSLSTGDNAPTSISLSSPLRGGAGGEAVEASASSLTPNTTYTYRLVADNGRVRLYGDAMTFTTLPNPPATVGDATVLNQGPMSAIIGFAIIDDGGETLTEVGCYVMEGEADNVADGAVKFPATETATASRQYRVVVTGLKMNATYTCFPYAVTRAGESIGRSASLTTSSAVTVERAGDFARLMDGATGTFDRLAIAGPLNGDDLRCLRGLAIKDINITDAHIVSGGEPYNGAYYTEDNIVGQQLFARCSSLTSISLPNDAVAIAQDAFADCTGLREITIPAAATEVTPSTGCTALANINVSPANSHYKSVDGVLTDDAVSRIVWFPMGKTGSYSLPATIASVGDYAFRGCAITDFTLPDGLTSLGQGAFAESRVESVTLPDKLRTVPTATFQHCAALTTVRLGSATELVSDYVFDGCPLTDLYIAASLPPVCNANAFTTTGADFTATCTLHVPKGRARYYKASKAWSRFKNITEE